jgi:hypothetical protein
MVTKQPFIALAVVISISIGLGLARPDLSSFAAAPASATKIDFDQVFADAARQGAGYVNRAHKGDRLPVVKSVTREPVLPYCEPVASPYSDPVLSRIAGHCDA